MDSSKDNIAQPFEKIGSISVIGGGIAGIQTALDIANSGFKVYLVEEKPSLGGVMAQLDKTFPTNDCSSCMMGPKLVELANHPNIEIMAYTDILNLDGQPGHFHKQSQVLFPGLPEHELANWIHGCLQCLGL